ncbi:general transcription factor II-I repeat domain-containing protein 2A-like [Hydra vulgaris]|uniref:General transcription factor II-I repeat domain-containing protein 2A-like n=1 Tax=Hydra vulgaris TaxID=6087 RepID=A0ABM4C0A3_HYDVU
MDIAKGDNKALYNKSKKRKIEDENRSFHGDWTEKNAVEVVQDLLNDLKNCEAFSLALDKSTDIQDKPQMAVIVRYVTSDVFVKEELLDLVELKDTTRGIDLKEALDTVLVKTNAPKNKLVSVASDGARAMVGKHIGLKGLLNSDPMYPEFIPVHCVIHREHLAAKHIGFGDCKLYSILYKK